MLENGTLIVHRNWPTLVNMLLHLPIDTVGKRIKEWLCNVMSFI